MQTVAEEVRARIQEELYEMLAARTVGLARLSHEPPSPDHRRLQLLGRPARAGAGAATPAIEVIIGVAPDDPACPLERTEYVRVGTQHALLRRIVHAAEIDTVIDTRLVVDSTTASPRVAHEMNVLGTMNILAACGGPGLAGHEGRLQVLRPLLRLRARRPVVLHRGDAAARTRRARRLESDIVEAEDAVQDFAAPQPRASP